MSGITQASENFGNQTGAGGPNYSITIPGVEEELEAK